MYPLNKYFDHIYVINLRSREDRKVAMLQKLRANKIQATFIEAVDGEQRTCKKLFSDYNNLSIEDPKSHSLEKLYNKKLIKSPGAFGVLLSYLSIINHAKKNDFERILVLEDDVHFHKKFNKKLEELKTEISDDWCLLYFGASQHVWDNIATTSKNYKTVSTYVAKNTDGAFAVGIRKSVFKIIEEQILNYNAPIDSGPLRSVAILKPKKCLVCYPNLIIADVSDSNIRDSRSQELMSKKFKWNLKEYSYPTELHLVSVIVACYNAESTILKSIQSIQNQTYPNLEIIVVDDGSKDNTVKIVDSIAMFDKRIKFIKLDVNGGVYKARNLGIKNSKGEFIVIQDADDIAIENRLIKQLVSIQSSNTAVNLGIIFRSEIEANAINIENELLNFENINSDSIFTKYQIGLNSSMFRSSVFSKYGYFVENRFGADLEFIERLLFIENGLKFDDININAIDYLKSEAGFIESINVLFDLVIISPKLNRKNLTILYGKKEREDFIKEYRTKFNLQEFQTKNDRRINGNIQIENKLEAELVYPTVRNLYDTEDSVPNQVTITQQQTKKMSKNYSSLENELIQYKLLYHNNLQKLDDVLNSKSWKYTAPIRKVIDIIQRLKK